MQSRTSEEMSRTMRMLTTNKASTNDQQRNAIPRAPQIAGP